MNAADITHPDLVTLTSHMAENGYTAQEIAYAVEKPWKHRGLLLDAQEASCRAHGGETT